MGNVLKMDKQQVIQGLIRLGWSDRAIHKESGIHRKTVSAYRKRFQNAPQVPADLQGAKIQNVPQVPTDSALAFNPPQPENTQEPLPPTQSQQIFPHRENIRTDILLGLTAQRIYQDLVETHGNPRILSTNFYTLLYVVLPLSVIKELERVCVLLVLIYLN